MEGKYTKKDDVIWFLTLKCLQWAFYSLEAPFDWEHTHWWWHKLKGYNGWVFSGKIQIWTNHLKQNIYSVEIISRIIPGWTYWYNKQYQITQNLKANLE